MKKIPVLMDCDPGHDDAMAIILALSSEKLNVLGITSACGNQTIEKTTKNARSVCEFLGRRDIPIAQGRKAPLLTPIYTAGIAHGDSGIDGPELPEPVAPMQEMSAVEFMAQQLEKSDTPIVIVPTGPLTNVATLILCYPHLIEKIDKIVLMGGSIVSGCSGLDVTNYTTIGFDEKEKFRETGQVGTLIADFADFFGRGFEMIGWCGVPVHDACTIAYLIDPTIFELKEMHVEIDLTGEFTMGSTVADCHGVEGKEPNVSVGISSDRDRFIELMLDACKKYEKGEEKNV